MFDLNLLNLPGATLQQGVMLLVAALLGFIIGLVGRRNKVIQLQETLVGVQRELVNSRRAPTGITDQEALILKRVQARAGEIDLVRIGWASPHEADDLKEIMGIGPFLEKKLHAVGIYTFRQIASFTKDDADKVNDVIEFFPGRIERDDWVGQATEIERKRRVQQA